MLQWRTGVRRLPAGAGAPGAVALPGDPGTGGLPMTLLEMSVQYAERAAAIRERITMLRGMERQESDLETARSLRRRVAELLPLWQGAGDLARLSLRGAGLCDHRPGTAQALRKGVSAVSASYATPLRLSRK